MAEYTATYSMVDAYGRSVSKQFTVEAVDQPTAKTAAADMAIDLAAISEANILWHTINDKTVYADSADAGANKDEGATFSVRKVDNEKAVIKVPAPVSAIFNTDGTVDLTNAFVVDFMANFLSGVFRISDHEVVDEILGGKLDD